MKTPADILAYVVADTSVHLHARPFTDIDWLNLTGAARVAVVVPRQVQRELDRQKDEHPVRHMKDRARAAIALVREYGAKTGSARELRQGVTLVYDRTFPGADALATLQLDPDRADDVILAAAVAWRDAHPEARTLVLTRDVGMELGAEELGLEAMLLPEPLERSAERDPRDAELERLREKVAQHEARLPKLRVQFADGRVHLDAPLHLPAARSEGSVEQAVAQALAKYPPMDRKADEAAAVGKAKARAPLSRGHLGYMLSGSPSFLASEEEYARYEQERRQYAEDVRRYLAAEEEYHLRAALTVPVAVVVENAGSAPAEDVRLALTFPPELHVETEETRPGPPAPPPVPRPPRTIMSVPDFARPDYARRERYEPHPTESEAESMYRVLGHSPVVSPWAPHLEVTGGGTVVTQTWHKIQQADQEAMEPLLVTFPSAEAVRPFTLRYEIRADHMAVTRGQIHVVAKAHAPS
jgi:hypothetical protein